MKRSIRSAFTLVELLVVIGIIALLIGILLPTLSQARSTAKRVVCLSNERQIAMATISYANDNEGFLAPRFRYSTNGELAAGQGDEFASPIWSTYFIDGNRQTVWQLGILANTGHLDVDQINPNPPTGVTQEFPGFFFCPATPMDGTTAYAGTFRSGYMYNPHWGVVVDNNGSWRRQSRYQKIVNMPQDKTLYMDVLPTFPQGVGHTGHYEENRPSWNLAFPDGHAVNVVSEKVAEMLEGRPASHWDRLDDYRDVLEDIAAGRSPTQEDWKWGGWGWGGSTRVPVYFFNQ